MVSIPLAIDVARLESQSQRNARDVKGVNNRLVLEYAAPFVRDKPFAAR
jgi:hypothetical protein